MNLLSGVTLAAGDSFSLALAGMGNYSDIQLHWTVTALATPVTLSGDTDGALATDPSALVAGTTGVVDFTNAPIVFGSQNGAVVDVWATFTVPEPTSGAMSVLALAALAARRRRRK